VEVLLPTLLPIAIAGAVVPTWTAHAVLLLGTTRPLLNSSLYVLGISVARAAIGLVVIYVSGTAAFESAVESAQPSGTGQPAPWVAGMGLLLLVVGGFLLTRKSSAEQHDELSGWLQRLEGFPPWAAFAWGVANFLMPGVQYVYFLGGMGVIVAPGLSQAAEVAWMLFFVLFLDLMLITPIVLFAVMRERAEPVLFRLKTWLGRNGARLAGAILAFFGLYLLLRGAGLIG